MNVSTQCDKCKRNLNNDKQHVCIAQVKAIKITPSKPITEQDVYRTAREIVKEYSESTKK